MRDTVMVGLRRYAFCDVGCWHRVAAGESLTEHNKVSEDVNACLDALAASQAETLALRQRVLDSANGMDRLNARIAEMEQEREGVRRVEALDDWHEEIGPALWWAFHKGHPYEPPYSGTPLDLDWPGYHTHFTRPFIPALGRMLKDTQAQNTEGENG